MKKAVVLLLMLVFIAACGGKTGDSQASSPLVKDIVQKYPALKDRKMTATEVKRVVDGDTFETKEGEKVRLIGVNTPETVKPNSPVEKFGKEASNFTKSKLTGKKVYLFSDAGDKDKYGRLLRYVFIEGDPVMFNETLVRDGYANTMSVPPNVMFQDLFRMLEREAREKKKGLWAYE
ncbi:thermonuclease family protein [Paenibacillus cremeus]|uniref:Thermonuclease family protein n=1 Tax=Paenibacillus cremeus TaxID=2163881 RepID=A0A559K9B6_9BACL|nr:thermonuclease family protein [Paenibacillus cremeus]TVY08725.1 thermonuclease family protein [Paenibacillus cremeus]